LSKRDEVIGGCRELSGEELHKLHFSSGTIRMEIVRRKRWSGHLARMGEKRNAYRIFVGKP
jgi:hypothetical protein